MAGSIINLGSAGLGRPAHTRQADIPVLAYQRFGYHAEDLPKVETTGRAQNITTTRCTSRSIMLLLYP